MIGKSLQVGADVFCDGHDKLAVVVQIRHESEDQATEVPMKFIANDRWHAEMIMSRTGYYYFRVAAWLDIVASWQDEVIKKDTAGLETSLECLELARSLTTSGEKLSELDRDRLSSIIELLKNEDIPSTLRLEKIVQSDTMQWLSQIAPRDFITHSEQELPVLVDRPRASPRGMVRNIPTLCCRQRNAPWQFR